MADDAPEIPWRGIYDGRFYQKQNERDREALLRISVELRDFLATRGITEADPEARALLADVESLERVAAWIGATVILTPARPSRQGEGGEQ